MHRIVEQWLLRRHELQIIMMWPVLRSEVASIGCRGFADTRCNVSGRRRLHVQHRRCTRGVRSNRYRLCSGLSRGDSSQRAVVMHRSRAKAVRCRRRI
jgi:hypothetical protein